MNKKLLLYTIWALIAVFAGSTAGVCIKGFGETSVILITLWRSKISCMGQIPFFINEYARNPKNSSSYLINNIPILFFSGILYSLQCVFAVLSFSKTSIAHSICFSHSQPVLVVIIQFFTRSKPSILQAIGVFVGFGGLIFMAFTASDTDGSTAYGDLLAFLSGSFLLVYLVLGKQINNKDTLWLYSCPVNFFATISSLIMLLALEKENMSKVLDWINPEMVFFAIYIGLVPGTFSHGTYNHIMKVLSPILVTSLLSLSLVFGAFVGICLGFQALPALCTIAGGAFSILGNTLTIFAEKKAKDEKMLFESKNINTDQFNDDESPEIQRIVLSNKIDREHIPGHVHIVMSETPEPDKQLNCFDDNQSDK